MKECTKKRLTGSFPVNTYSYPAESDQPDLQPRSYKRSALGMKGAQAEEG